jgi:hypothetical protein
MKIPSWIPLVLFSMVLLVVLACPRSWAGYGGSKREPHLEGVSYSEMFEWQAQYGRGGYYGYGMGPYYGPRPGFPYGNPGTYRPCKRGPSPVKGGR